MVTSGCLVNRNLNITLALGIWRKTVSKQYFSIIIKRMGYNSNLLWHGAPLLPNRCSGKKVMPVFWSIFLKHKHNFWASSPSTWGGFAQFRPCFSKKFPCQPEVMQSTTCSSVRIRIRPIRWFKNPGFKLSYPTDRSGNLCVGCQVDLGLTLYITLAVFKYFYYAPCKKNLWIKEF